MTKKLLVYLRRAQPLPDPHKEVSWCHFEGRTDRVWRCQSIPNRYMLIARTRGDGQ